MEEEIEVILERSEEALAANTHLFEKDFWEDTASRAYYCIYHCVQALLLDLDIHPKSHQGCHRMFHKNYVSTDLFERKFGIMLIETFELRQKGDYDYSYDLTQLDAEKSLQYAKQFLTKTKSYFSG